MCSHYQAEKRRAFYEKRFGIKLPPEWEPPRSSNHIYPTQFAPIVRRPPERESGDEAVSEFEVVDARFGLLPGFAKEVKYGTRTYNARSETVASLASFKQAWAKARHCVVPCEAIYEPDWRTGTHIPTRFTSADGGTLGVAGLWQPWKSPAGVCGCTNVGTAKPAGWRAIQIGGGRRHDKVGAGLQLRGSAMRTYVMSRFGEYVEG